MAIPIKNENTAGAKTFTTSIIIAVVYEKSGASQNTTDGHPMSVIFLYTTDFLNLRFICYSK